MKRVKAIGVGIFFCSLSVLLAGGVGIPRKEDMPKYLKMLQTSMSAADRKKAAEMIGKRGAVSASDVDDAIAPLKKTLQKDIDAGVRAAAASALGIIRPEAKDTVPLLVERVKTDNSMNVKLASTVALGQYGADAKEAVPALRELAKKFDAKKAKKENQMIMTALQSIGAGKKKKKD